ncbi:class I SAM-dependent methyltransferase [Motilibacter deserti]|uniref:Methyltransferase domain-containing protein n=1 Tax=Motilibacter deserti TaxID=2714956 RepID=A0ABX0H3Y0_9ACTN|nr:class I SAM-dependent methyltransferase [Motilibacter deserti]NHC16469.1 methyltransferase domain-containing protein [Motilibacter deserti]
MGGRDEPGRHVRPVVAGVRAVARVAPGAKPWLQKALVRLGYRLVNRRAFAPDSDCLNYGYATADDVPDGSPDHFGRNLYAAVAGAVDLRGARVLEVGCGRGGGTAYVAERFSPAAVTGVDLARSAVAWCRRRHRRPGLTFVRGDAERLPFGDASFEAVLSVESSHNYPRVDRFFAEARRVLVPGGHLLLADLRPTASLPRLTAAAREAGFVPVEEERITAAVLRSMELDSARRAAAVERGVPRALQAGARGFVGVAGTEIFERLRTGRMEYVRLVLRAPHPG